MITRQTGKKLIKASGILAILLNIGIIVAMIAGGKWSILNIFEIIAHISLFVVAYYSLQMSEYDFKKYMGIGIFAGICTGLQFSGSIYLVLLRPSIWALLCLLMLPISILFMMGVVFYERGEKSEYND